MWADALPDGNLVVNSFPLFTSKFKPLVHMKWVCLSRQNSLLAGDCQGLCRCLHGCLFLWLHRLVSETLQFNALNMDGGRRRLIGKTPPLWFLHLSICVFVHNWWCSLCCIFDRVVICFSHTHIYLYILTGSQLMFSNFCEIKRLKQTSPPSSKVRSLFYKKWSLFIGAFMCHYLYIRLPIESPSKASTPRLLVFGLEAF